MTVFRIDKLKFSDQAIDEWVDRSGRHQDWPVVYLLHDSKQIYIGETTSARARLRQHRKNPERQRLKAARIVIDEEFNKSACLDLESRLIGWFAGEDRFTVTNKNDGQTRSDYFERTTRYQRRFDEIFAELRRMGYFQRTIPEIENDNLFKLSPFKALTHEQAIAINGIVEGLQEDLGKSRSLSVVSGGPGTGKTIVAIYLLKLIRDIQQTTDVEDLDRDSLFSDFFVEGAHRPLDGRRIGFVVPQQSLRNTVKSVFKRVPGLRDVDVLSQYDARFTTQRWDVLVVDEGHRLHHHPTHPSDRKGRTAIEKRMTALGIPPATNSLDWIRAFSDHQIVFVDSAQSIRPNDVEAEVIRQLIGRAGQDGRHYTLDIQMRVTGGAEYIEFARSLFTESAVPAPAGEYDLRFYDDFRAMRRDVLHHNEPEGPGLARLVAGFAWKWRSKSKKAAAGQHDIEIDGVELIWNKENLALHSREAEPLVWSIHTTQGHDLNYAGVIIGPDIVWDERSNRVRANRARVADRVVEQGTRGDDDALLEDLLASYFVLLTRGMRGTYVYVCDPALRDHLRDYFPDVRRESEDSVP